MYNLKSHYSDFQDLRKTTTSTKDSAIDVIALAVDDDMYMLLMLLFDVVAALMKKTIGFEVEVGHKLKLHIDKEVWFSAC